MKTFLNVVGALALCSGPGAIFLGENVAAQVIGGLVLLLAITALGLAKLIDLAEDEAAAAKKHRAAEVAHWSYAGSRVASTLSTPPIPTEPKWYVANGQEVTGPFTKPQLLELRKKGVLNAETKLNAEGAPDWQAMASVLA